MSPNRCCRQNTVVCQPWKLKVGEGGYGQGLATGATALRQQICKTSLRGLGLVPKLLLNLPLWLCYPLQT